MQSEAVVRMIGSPRGARLEAETTAAITNRETGTGGEEG